MKTAYRLFVLIIGIYLILMENIYSQETPIKPFNPFRPESINHWGIRISSLNWESATIKNALAIPYVTYFTDLAKGKNNLLVHDSPKKLKGTSYRFSTPRCDKDSCGDFYIDFRTTKSNFFPSTKQYSEFSKTTLQQSGQTVDLIISNESLAFFSSSKQDLNNIVIGYQKDRYFFQSMPYLRNLGIRFGYGLDIYQYKATIQGWEYLVSTYREEYPSNPSNNKITTVNSNLLVTDQLDYIEAVVKLKIGVNYIYEFLQSHLVFVGMDYVYGYGAVSYKLRENRLNPDIQNILNSSNVFAFTLALPSSKLTDGPAFLEIPGFEYYISYGYKIEPKQIVRLVYRYKQETHTLRLPKIEPDEFINLAALSAGDVTPLILSDVKPRGMIPSNTEFMREIGIEYMYKF